LIKSGGVKDDKWRSFLKGMTPVSDQAATIRTEWKRGSAALVGFYERIEGLTVAGDISSTLRKKIAEIDALVAEQNADLGVLRDFRLFTGESVRDELVSGSGEEA
jgi:hypothetical protein